MCPPRSSTFSRLRIAVLWGIAFLLWLAPSFQTPDWYKSDTAGREKLTAQISTGVAGFYRVPAACAPPAANFSPSALNSERNTILHVLLDLTPAASFPRSLSFIYITPAVLTAAVWNAFSVFHLDARQLFETGIPRAADNICTLRNRNIAISYAGARVVEAVGEAVASDTPSAAATRLLDGLGLDPNERCTADLSNPACVGNKAAAMAIDWMNSKGYNIDGCFAREVTCNPSFADNAVSAYVPKNTVHRVKDIYAWQPLLETDGGGNYWAQEFATAYVASSDPLVVPRSLIDERKAAYKKPSKREYKAQVDAVLAASVEVGRNETVKMLTEFVGGAGRWLSDPIRFVASKQPDWDQTTTLMFFVGLRLVSMDAHVLTIKEKLRLDTVRPPTAVRVVYGSKLVTAYAGPKKGVTKIPGDEWKPYFPNAPDPEYASGQVCTCTVLAEWIELFTKTQNLGLPWAYRMGCSGREPGVSPSTNISGSIATTQELLKVCQDARVWGGMHFPAATTAATGLCTGMAKLGLGVLSERLLPDGFSLSLKP